MKKAHHFCISYHNGRGFGFIVIRRQRKTYTHLQIIEDTNEYAVEKGAIVIIAVSYLGYYEVEE